MRAAALSFFVATLMALPVHAQTIERIKETKELKLGFRIDAAPLSYVGSNGTPDGYSPSVCIAVAEFVANALELETLNAIFIDVDSNNRFEKVASGEIDLLCGAATITLRRREVVDFSDPIYVDGVSFMLPVAAEESLTGLAGKKVGVRDGTTTKEAVSNTLEAAGIDATIVAISDHAAGMTAMENAEIDAYFADQSILFELYNSSDQQEKFKLFNRILTFEKQGLAMALGDTEFRLLVDTALSNLYDNGIMDEIYKEELPNATPGGAIKAMRLMAPTLP